VAGPTGCFVGRIIVEAPGIAGENADLTFRIAGCYESRELLAFVGADEFAFGEDVPFHGLQEPLFGRSSGHLQFGVEGIDLKVVVVDAVAFLGGIGPP
jgi:hypothetical protein